MKNSKLLGWQMGLGLGAVAGLAIEISLPAFASAIAQKDTALAINLIIVMASAAVGALIGLFVDLIHR